MAAADIAVELTGIGSCGAAVGCSHLRPQTGSRERTGHGGTGLGPHTELIGSPSHHAPNLLIPLASTSPTAGGRVETDSTNWWQAVVEGEGVAQFQPMR